MPRVRTIQGDARYAPPRIVVVGAGFTGTVLAAQLLGALRRPATVTLVEATRQFGPGLAYSTSHPALFMNTRAHVISALAGKPSHFLDWLGTQRDAESDQDAFVPRSLYGRYLSELLDSAAGRSDIPLSRVTAEVIDVSADSRGMTLKLASGASIGADHVVLCVGYGPRQARRGAGRIVDDPWSNWCERVAPDDAILFRGSGLTMIDQIVRLASNGHRGKLLAVSRRGLMPTVQVAPVDVASLDPPPRLRPLVRWIRIRATEHRTSRGAWRAAVDGLRPHAQTLWLGFTRAERERFLRHLQPYWSIHRHRMPPSAAQEIQRVLAIGQLKVCAGRLGAPEESPTGVAVPFTSRRRQLSTTLRAHWLVDCSDPQNALAASPLGFALVARGFASRGATGIALRVGVDGTVRDGLEEVPGLYGVGPAARSVLGEITAIPEIREQAAQVAARIARVVNSESTVA